jgi:4-amino-4-deoxy-L-arabinose transferase-like glycosyltransferase
MIRPIALPPSPGLLALVVLAFVLPGLVGHDAWKSYDAIGIEIVHQMRVTGDWLVPRLAGEPWLEDPPLYHWFALAFATLSGWALPFHDAVRLASGSFLLAACAFLYWAARGFAREDDRDTAGAAAVLLLVGSVGLIVHAHEAITDHAALASASAAFAALAHFPRRPLAAGAAFGVALGLAFLASGIVVPLALYVAMLTAWAACREWRTRKALGAFAIGALLLALMAAAWPVALYARFPELAHSWWRMLTTGRDFSANLRYFLGILSWFAWPAWPIAAWALWSQRRQLGEPRLYAPLAAFVLTLVAVCRFSPAQDINALVLLPPLALLGARGVAQLRRGAAAALDWFGIMTFSFFAGLIWLGYVAMMTGVPPRVANNFVKNVPGFVAHFAWLPFVVALAFTLGWIYLLARTPRGATRGVLRWAAGVALVWGLFATLIMPWADYQKSYRNVALQLKSKLPRNAGCVEGRGFGAPQLAALSYHAGLPTSRVTTGAAVECRFLLVQANPRVERDAPGAGWVKIADEGRPGDKSERYRLYQRSAR